MKSKPFLYILLIIIMLFILVEIVKAAKKIVMSSENIQYVVDDLPKSLYKKYDSRGIDAIDKVVIHHSAVGGSGGDPWAFARYHVNTNKWPGIGYHYVIQKDGLIYQTQNLSTKSYHAGNANNSSIGICLSGDFDNEKPTFNQQEKLVYLINYLQDYLGRNLSVHGHNEYSSKSCPGANVDLNAIRQNIKKIA
jgi:N-acetylmuramoyl-L-alanine amidase